MSKQLCFCLPGALSGNILPDGQPVPTDQQPVLWCCQLEAGFLSQCRFYYGNAPGGAFLSYAKAIGELLSWTNENITRGARFNSAADESPLCIISWYLEVEFRYSLGETFLRRGCDPADVRKYSQRVDNVFQSARKRSETLFREAMKTEAFREKITQNVVMSNIK